MLGPCFQIVFLMSFIVQQAVAEKESWLICFDVVKLSMLCVLSS